MLIAQIEIKNWLKKCLYTVAPSAHTTAVIMKHRVKSRKSYKKKSSLSSLKRTTIHKKPMDLVSFSIYKSDCDRNLI